MADVKGLVSMVAVGPTEKRAREEVQKLMPFPLGHENYLTCDITTALHANGYVATAVYELKPGVNIADKVQRSGVGSYRTPLEERVGKQESSL